MKPARQPVSSPSGTATSGGQPSRKNQASTVAERANAVPAERSMPPAMMMTVMPKAATATVDDCTNTARAFATEQNVLS